MYERRLAGCPSPWTTDPILASYRFTNAYRVCDRVSQYLIRHVLYDRTHSAQDLVLRTLLFRWFNKPETWELLVSNIGEPAADDFDADAAGAVLSDAMARRQKIYSAAYIVPPVPSSSGPKHLGHLMLTRTLIEEGLTTRVASAASLRELYEVLLQIPGVGRFLAYQLAIDLNYSTVANHGEDEFVVAGPGAMDGLSKVFPGSKPSAAADLIRRVADEQHHWFAHFGLEFRGLLGRPLQLVDCQNLFCEISKYSRVAFPAVRGVAGRTRIKNVFRPAGLVPPPFYPPKWGLEMPAA